MRAPPPLAPSMSGDVLGEQLAAHRGAPDVEAHFWAKLDARSRHHISSLVGGYHMTLDKLTHALLSFGPFNDQPHVFVRPR